MGKEDRFFSIYNRDFLKQIKGTKCANCKQECGDAILFHHIVPLSIGGNDLYSNIVPLCDNCHNLIHFGKGKNNTFSHSELVKAGIQKAKQEGKKVGRPNLKKEEIPQDFLDIYPLVQKGIKNVTQASKELNISRTTFYKYKRLLEENIS